VAHPTASYKHEFKGFSPFLKNICPQGASLFHCRRLRARFPIDIGILASGIMAKWPGRG
jgi:hypothetical protein